MPYIRIKGPDREKYIKFKFIHKSTMKNYNFEAISMAGYSKAGFLETELFRLKSKLLKTLINLFNHFHFNLQIFILLCKNLCGI